MNSLNIQLVTSCEAAPIMLPSSPTIVGGFAHAFSLLRGPGALSQAFPRGPRTDLKSLRESNRGVASWDPDFGVRTGSVGSVTADCGLRRLRCCKLGTVIALS